MGSTSRRGGSCVAGECLGGAQGRPRDPGRQEKQPQFPRLRLPIARQAPRRVPKRSARDDKSLWDWVGGRCAGRQFFTTSVLFRPRCDRFRSRERPAPGYALRLAWFFDCAPGRIVHRWRDFGGASLRMTFCQAVDSASRRFQVLWLRRKLFFKSSRMRSKSAWVRRRFQAGFFENQG